MKNIFSEIIDSSHRMDKLMYGQLNASFATTNIHRDFLLILNYRLEA